MGSDILSGQTTVSKLFLLPTEKKFFLLEWTLYQKGFGVKQIHKS